jgi:dTMP kinase
LRAGFVVLTDRYIYSAIARAVVRGADPNWIRAIYGIALVPDAVFYLRVGSPEELAGRVLNSGRGFGFWESGMDMGLGNDYYDSFVAYQKLMLKEFDRMRGEYDFKVIDASKPVKRVAGALKRSIGHLLESEAKTAEPSERERPRVEATPKVKAATQTTPAKQDQTIKAA